MLINSEEMALIKTRQKSKQLCFAVVLKHYQTTYEFIEDFSNIAEVTIRHISNQLEVLPNLHKLSQRTYDHFRAIIRSYCQTSFPTKKHHHELKYWLKVTVLPTRYLKFDEIKLLSKGYLRQQKIEVFKEKTLARIVRDAVNEYGKALFLNIYKKISSTDEARIYGLLLFYKDGLSYLGWLNKAVNNPSLESMLCLLDQWAILNTINVGFIQSMVLPRKRLLYYNESLTRLNPSDLKRMPDNKRCVLLIFYIYIRKQQITDKIIDMFNYMTRNIIHKAEKRVVNRLINEVKRVYGKDTLLFNIAEVCLMNPDKTIRDKIYPVVGEEKLGHIIDEYKRKGSKYQNILHRQVRCSYANYYRRMIYPLLENIIFQSNNKAYQSILDGLRLIKDYFYSGKKYFPDHEIVPNDFLPYKWKKRIIDKKTGKTKRICYEVYLLKKLGDRIKCREIWVPDAFKHRNPDEDLPKTFEDNPTPYFDALNLPIDVNLFINSLKTKLKDALTALDKNLPSNDRVRILSKKGGRIVVSPLTPQQESKTIARIKKHLQEKWHHIHLIDVLKEVELSLHLTKDFVSYGDKTYLTPEEISKRLLLVIYGFGTNVGLKPMCAGNTHVTDFQLRHIKNYFLTEDNLKNALSKIANHLFKVRLKQVWGEMPIAVASDSTQFSAYFQNLISEYHHRYGGRGVMIYWHVEKNACCIHSKLKSVSSSEVSAMIEGVLNHCTSMSIKKNYVDTHGQSEVGFAFAYLLGFSLMPRLANLRKQKLSQCELGDYQTYKNLQAVLGDCIDWQLIQEQYHQMVKYAAAMKEGYADPESVLRRFTRNNLKHPTYRALSQLGKVVKTIFICQYLMHESIRQEIQEGLNVIELWNGVSKFIFYGRSGEISSNHEKTQTLSVLSLHLLQLSMVYVNTLMLQKILVEHRLLNILTDDDKRAITPLIYEHINPYGLFRLDLTTRLQDIDHKEAA
jgi:TnpA family transposase